uniref:Glutathione peroxidase n=1 Tax=Elaeophora elaphi TaxID=1147741 RepID=A0A0R3RL78_9BILA
MGLLSWDEPVFQIRYLSDDPIQIMSPVAAYLSSVLDGTRGRESSLGLGCVQLPLITSELLSQLHVLIAWKPIIIIIVNVASQCNLANTNYKELEQLQKFYKDKGLAVVAFPCNQFGSQVCCIIHSCAVFDECFAVMLCSVFGIIHRFYNIHPFTVFRNTASNSDRSLMKMSSATTIYDFTVKDADGKDVSLGKYRGKPVVIVNVASQCGLTNSNYTELKELVEHYKDKGLAVAAFPCNQFGGQEPKCELEVKNFVAEKFHFEPDLYGKIDVNGKNAAPLFDFLKHEKGGLFGDNIKWNFTKFLIDQEGHPVGVMNF